MDTEEITTTVSDTTTSLQKIGLGLGAISEILKLNQNHFDEHDSPLFGGHIVGGLLDAAMLLSNMLIETGAKL